MKRIKNEMMLQNASDEIATEETIADIYSQFAEEWKEKDEEYLASKLQVSQAKNARKQVLKVSPLASKINSRLSPNKVSPTKVTPSRVSPASSRKSQQKSDEETTSPERRFSENDTASIANAIVEMLLKQKAIYELLMTAPLPVPHPSTPIAPPATPIAPPATPIAPPAPATPPSSPKVLFTVRMDNPSTPPSPSSGKILDFFNEMEISDH